MSDVEWVNLLISAASIVSIASIGLPKNDSAVSRILYYDLDTEKQVQTAGG